MKICRVLLYEIIYVCPIASRGPISTTCCESVNLIYVVFAKLDIGLLTILGILLIELHSTGHGICIGNSEGNSLR